MSLNVCRHTPNGLRARDEYGRMVCGRCGRPYDDEKPLDKTDRDTNDRCARWARRRRWA